MKKKVSLRRINRAVREARKRVSRYTPQQRQDLLKKGLEIINKGVQ